MKALSVIVVCLFGLALGACSGSPTSATPSEAALTTTEVYVGTMSPGGSGFYSFQVINPGPVSVTLASLTAASSGTTVSSALEIGIGVPAGEICEVAASVVTAPSLAAQLTRSVSANIYCVRLSDLGGLMAPVAFGVRIVHP